MQSNITKICVSRWHALSQDEDDEDDEDDVDDECLLGACFVLALF